MIMLCPKCNGKKLKEIRTLHDVRIDCCKACRGIWFDHGELEEIFTLAAKELTLSIDSLKQRYKCPRCSKPLYSFPYPQTDVIIDMCSECHGLWLDANELTRIQQERLKLLESGELEETLEADYQLEEISKEKEAEELPEEAPLPESEIEIAPSARMKPPDERTTRNLFIDRAYKALKAGRD